MFATMGMTVESFFLKFTSILQCSRKIVIYNQLLFLKCHIGAVSLPLIFLCLLQVLYMQTQKVRSPPSLNVQGLILLCLHITKEP